MEAWNHVESNPLLPWVALSVLTTRPDGRQIIPGLIIETRAGWSRNMIFVANQYYTDHVWYFLHLSEFGSVFAEDWGKTSTSVSQLYCNLHLAMDGNFDDRIHCTRHAVDRGWQTCQISLLYRWLLHGAGLSLSEPIVNLFTLKVLLNID